MLHNVSLRYPTPLRWERWARNGQIADGKAIARVGSDLAHNITWRARKTILEKWYDAGGLVDGVSGTAHDIIYTGTHVGHNTSQIWAIVNFAPAYGAGISLPVDPYAKLAIRDGFSGGSIVYSNESHCAAATTSSTAPGPNQISWRHILKVNCTPDQDYRIWLVLANYARILSVTIIEVAAHPMDDTDTGAIDPRSYVGQPCLDSQLDDWLDASTKAWRDSGQQIAVFARDSAARAPTVSSTGYTAIATGQFKIDRTYCNSRGQASIPVRMAVRAVRTAGAAASPSNKVRFRDAGSTDVLEVTGIDATTNWYTVAGTITPGSDTWLIEAGAYTLNTVRVDAVCVWEEDP